MKDMEIVFSKAVPQDIVDRCISIKTEYNHRCNRVVTLGFTFDPYDGHGQSLANVFSQAIRHANMRGNEYGIYVETIHKIEDGHGDHIRSGSVTSLNRFIGHQVIHEPGKDSVVYVIMEYLPVKRKPEH